MKYIPSLGRVAAALIVGLAITILSVRTKADSGLCGGSAITIPFTDVGNSFFFCQIAAAYFTGLTTGTTATTFSPTDAVTREQMAAFATRTLDQSLRRGSKRAIAQQWWTPKTLDALRATKIPIGNPYSIAWDGDDLWVSAPPSHVYRLRASDGRILEAWTTPYNSYEILVAAGRVFIASSPDPEFPGVIYYIDPTKTPGEVSFFANTPTAAGSLTFDGQFIWVTGTGLNGFGGSITRIPLSGGAGTTFTEGIELPGDILWDGENLWLGGLNSLKRIDPSNGSILESIPLGFFPRSFLFDGLNLWLNGLNGNSVSIVRASGTLRGKVLATLTGNGLNHPGPMAFDGERVLVVNFGDPNPPSLSLFKAADLSPLGNHSLSPNAGTIFIRDVCSDGLNFWLTESKNSSVLRF